MSESSYNVAARQKAEADSIERQRRETAMQFATQMQAEIDKLREQVQELSISETALMLSEAQRDLEKYRSLIRVIYSACTIDTSRFAKSMLAMIDRKGARPR